MTRTVTRRDVLRAGGVGAATLLAGCSATSGDGEAGDTTASPAADGAGSDAGGAAGGSTGAGADTRPGPERIGAVTEVMLRTPLEIQVQRAEQVDTVASFGFEREPQPGMLAYSVTLAFRNASDAYVSFATEGFAMLADDEQIVDEQQFADLTSDTFGGVPLVPGDVRTYDIGFEVPEGASRYGLGGQFAVRVLPGTEFVSVPTVLVDFAENAGRQPLTHSFGVPFRGLDEPVGVAGVRVTVREVFFVDEIAGSSLRDGEVFGVADVRIENGAVLPIAAGMGVGGFGFQDVAGRTYVSSRGARNRVGDREILRLPNGVQPGESAEGLLVAAVPAGTGPLYLTYTPAPALYAASETVRENKFLWEAR